LIGDGRVTPFSPARQLLRTAAMPSITHPTCRRCGTTIDLDSEYALLKDWRAQRAACHFLDAYATECFGHQVNGVWISHSFPCSPLRRLSPGRAIRRRG